MKKIIILIVVLILSIPLSLLADYIISEDGTLIRQVIQGTTAPQSVDESSTTPPPATDAWIGAELPTDVFNVLEYGLKGDGKTDDSTALKELAKNTNVTNWYFPKGYTFLLYDVIPPKHVKFIWGSGTLRRKLLQPTDPNFTKWQQGVLNIWHTVVIDGLTFDNQPEKEFHGSESMGQLGISGENPDEPEFSSDGIEIRNCHFDGSGVWSDGISIFTGKTGQNKHANLKIYNNTFFNAGHFGIEGGDRTEPQNVNQNSLPGLWVFNNHFTASEPKIMAISIVRQRVGSPTKIFNNTIDGLHWGIELPSCDGVEVYGNVITNTNEYAFLEGQHTEGGPWGGTPLPTGHNLIHDNWFGDKDGTSTADWGSFILLYAGSSSEFYDNYIRSKVIIQRHADYIDTKGGHWHHNTFVLNHKNNGSSIIQTDGDITTFNFHDNILYGTESGITGISIGNSTDAKLANNEIHLATGGNCISGTTQTGGSCDTNYNAIPPQEDKK